MTITVLKSSFIKLMAREIYYRNYKNFSTNSFREGLTLSLNRINKAFNSFKDTFMKTLNRHTRMKKNLSEQMRYLIRLEQLWKDLNSKVNISKIKVIKTWKFMKAKALLQQIVEEGKKKKFFKIDTHKTMDNKTFRKQLYHFYF